MTEAQAIEAISKRWVDTWPGLQPSVTFPLPNESFTPPQGASWARISIIHTVRRQATMGPIGGAKFESRGQIFVNLFTPLDVGGNALALLADSARSVFERQNLGTPTELNVYAGASGEPRRDPDGPWFMQTVTFPFRYIAAG